ncbi:HEAT repeat domain-containing protein [Leptothoe sp. ISB3NOV94-8A]
MAEALVLAGAIAAGQFLAKEVLGKLAKETLEEYAKDFFKERIADASKFGAPDALKQGIAKTLKEFLYLFQEELVVLGLPEALVRHQYQKPLKQLLEDPEVRHLLVQAFDPESKGINGDVLAAKWETLPVGELAHDIDWENLAKQYSRKVKVIIRQDQDLGRQLELYLAEAQKISLEAIAGVPVDFDLKQYQETLREKFGNLRLDSLDTTGAAYNSLRLWRMFIPQNVRQSQEFTPQLYELPKEELRRLQAEGAIDEAILEAEVMERSRKAYVDRPIESVVDVVGLEPPEGIDLPAAQGNPVPLVVILGDPGSGKSTLLQYMALSWAEKSPGELKDRPIPILIELRTYGRDKQTGKCSDFLEYWHQGNTACRLNQNELDKLLKSGNAIVLFDGVDEVFDPVLREEVVNDIHRFSNSYDVQIVVTSRWLGYKAERLRNADFHHYMLQDLDDEQIETFVQRWHDLTFTDEADKIRKRDRLKKAIGESKPIRNLAGNPLLLTMMAILNRNQELPRDRARLYERASEVLLHQWDVEAKLLENEQLKEWSIDVRDKQAMLRKVAYHMQSCEAGLAGNVISREDLEQVLIDYLKTIEVGQARTVARVMIDQLRTRNFILCDLGADRYGFVHRTFLEYFCAAEFVRQFEKEQKIDIKYLKNELYGEHFRDEAWDEVLRLIAGIIEPHFVGDIINALLDIPKPNLWDHTSASGLYLYSNLVRFSVYLKPSGIQPLLLASYCLLEIRNRHEITQADQRVFQTLLEAAKQQHPYLLDEDAASDVSEILWELYDHEYQILKTLINLDEFSKTPQVIVKGFAKARLSDPDTLPLLKDRAQHDDNWSVRRSAVQELARGWKDDPDTLPLLKDRAQHDDNWSVRRSAVQELAQGWKDDLDTLPWLKDRAQHDDDNDVRRSAVQELARGWKDDPDTLPLLKDRAQHDDDNDVRRSAVQELARGWKDDLNLFDFWCHITLNDPFEGESSMFVENPRQIALQVLVRQYSQHPKTLELLNHRAANDTDKTFRDWAQKQLTRFRKQ